MPATRLDRELLARGLARSRSHAQQQIAAGHVRLNGTVVRRPAEPVAADDRLESTPDPYVSRAAHKLLGALEDLRLTPAGRALDAGASTGGFTQVLLERGCRPVYAVDVGSDQLAEGVRTDPRVVVHERTNLRELGLQHVGGEPVDLVVADVSFISLVLLLAPLAGVTRSDGRMLLMVKPQFEVGREQLGKGGVVRSTLQHVQSVSGVIGSARGLGWHARAVAPSRLPGPAGNREYFVLLTTTPPAEPVDLDAVVG